MVITTNSNGMDPQVLSDLQAVMKRLIDGTPVDAETSQRIEERADRISEEIMRSHGEIDDETLNQLLRDVRDDV